MAEMFSWYIDNSKYFTEEFSRMIIKYSLEAQRENVNITDMVEKYSPGIGNKSSNITAARDFGIINNESMLSDGAIMYESGFYHYSDFVLDQISKRNVSKSKNIPLKPLVILAKSFELMRQLNLDENETFLTTEECYKYLSVIEIYDELTTNLINTLVSSRVYKEDSHIPKKTIQNMSNAVCLSELFSALADSKLFELGEQKSIIKPSKKYWECINYIANNGDSISLSPTVAGRNNEELYNYLCDINTGIKEIIPEIEFQKIPSKKLTKRFYLYLFGIKSIGVAWSEYFDKDYFGIYRIFFPLERILFAKLYTKYKELAENLCDYSIQAKPYFEEIKGGKLMITEPFENGHANFNDLNEDESIIYATGCMKEYPRNRILFGAPGTGKSFTLNEEKDKLLGKDSKDYERVTFHPDYSYANFVGTYKPIMVKNEDDILSDLDKKDVLSILQDKYKSAQEKYDLLFDKFKDDGLTRLPILLGLYSDENFKTKKLDGSNAAGDNSVERNHGRAIRPYVNLVTDVRPSKEIAYEYVPGPFMNILVKALKSGMTDSPKPFLLIIEEINRANVAAVFGDVFQLLDRDKGNVSEYAISTTNDMRSYLAQELNVDESFVETIKIPDNLFIWATMNSADQGVFPMDTAFKRRWDFTYLGIDDALKEMSDEIKGNKHTLGTGSNARYVKWNDLRSAINDVLSSESYNINEDKLLGPYFISKSILESKDNAEFIKVFKNKVLMYLFDDAAKQKRKTFFEKCKDEVKGVRYSDLCNQFDTKGVFIFPEEVSKRFTEKPTTEEAAEANEE